MKNVLLITLLCSMVVMAGCSHKQQQEVADIMDDTIVDEQVDDTDSEENAPVADDIADNGEQVSVNYVGSLEDGTVFDTSRQDVAEANEIYNPQRPYEPLQFTLGAGQMIPGFDKGVVGMKVGDTKTITIAPADGYGEIKPELVQEVPLSGFEAGGITPEVGETYTVGFAQGVVTAINGDTVEMDFNHFLAGETLIFEVELVAIQ